MAKNTNAPNAPANYRQLAGSERHAAIGASLTGPADPAEKVNVIIVLRSHSGAPPLPDHQYWMNTPPGKRKFLTAEESARLYAADPAEMQAVRAFLQTHGFAIDEANSKSRSIAFSGTVAQMDAAFGVTLGYYQTPTQRYRGREGFIYLPDNIAPFVVGVFGLDNRQMARRSNPPAGAATLTVQQVMKLYDFPTTGANGQQAIGLFEFANNADPANPVPAGFTPDDIKSYFNSLQPPLTRPTITSVPLNGASNQPTGDQSDVEVALDIDVAGTVAQGAPINVYFTTWDQLGWIAVLNALIHPSATQPTNTTVVSISWGWPEFETINNFQWSAAAITTISGLFQQAAAQGITIFASSGDLGSNCGLDDGKCHVLYPASDPWITCVGGTILTNVNGNNFDENTWNDDTGATGGGVSDTNPLPAWQANAGVPASKNSGFNGRGIPDIAGNASPNSGYNIWSGGIEMPSQGGTSATAPLYAGLMAIINAALGEPVGFLNPTLYALPAVLVFNDIADGVTNELSGGATCPSYTSAPGWDACTGLGSIRGKALLQQLQQIYTKKVEFIIGKSTYSLDEYHAVSVEQMHGQNGLATFQQAMFVTIDGFTPAGLGVTTPNTAPPLSLAPVINTTPDLKAFNVKIVPVGVSSDDPSFGPEVQRITFTYDVQFADDSAFSQVSGITQLLPVTVSLSSNNPDLQPFLGEMAEIELTTQADPYFNNASIDPDLKVFQLNPGQSIPGFPQLTLQDDPLALINQLLDLCNSLPSDPNHPYAVLGTFTGADAINWFGTSPQGLECWPVLLPSDTQFFAIARVRYRSLSTFASDVRVFFRMYSWDSIPVYDQFTNNRMGGMGSIEIPLLGIDGNGMLTSIPFFAFNRVDAAANDMNSQTDLTNVKTLSPDAGGNETFTYFGCWLDINSPTALYEVFPAPRNGPFGGSPLPLGGNSNPALEPIMPLIFGNFNLNAEIKTDPLLIPMGATPQTSDKVARQEISFTSAANPGQLASRRVPMTFKFRPNLTLAINASYPDELMIDWTGLPSGSTATIYLPALDAAQLLQAAEELYPHHSLQLVDAHTLQCEAGGITYIPIPHSLSLDYSGLLSVDLPFGITKGQVFTVTIRQITDAFDRRALVPPSGRLSRVQRRRLLHWRRVIGTSTMTIPVSTKELMLAVEEKRLAGLLYAIEHGKRLTGSRLLVLRRMLEQVRERFVALGGDPSTVVPSNGGKETRSRVNIALLSKKR